MIITLAVFTGDEDVSPFRPLKLLQSVNSMLRGL
jgi:hypothetical protein